MATKNALFIQLIFLFIIDGISESIGLCYENDMINGKSLLLITFGFGSDQYSNKTPASYNFSTTYQQKFEPSISTGLFAFVNAVPNNFGWFIGALDYTMNDVGGYMYFIDIAINGGLLFKSTVNNLCIGQRYEFSAYLANVLKKQHNGPKPNLQFEVRSATTQNNLVAQFITGDIPDYDKMTWLRYGISFIVSTQSVDLLITATSKGYDGNDLAIDDIELRVCSTVYPSYDPLDCSSPLITLIPNAPYLSKPFQFKQSQDIHINSKLQFNSMHQPSSIIYKWSIFICLSTCSNEIQLNNLLDTTQNDLFIRSRILTDGIYELQLTVITTGDLSKMSSSSSIYIEITHFDIITNLVLFGRLRIKHHFEEDLILNPGKYSIDPNRIIFDPNKWNYTYYCGLYDFNTPINREELKLFDDSNQNCFSNKSNAWKYNNSSTLSVKIFSRSLKSHQTYQFMVHMINYEDSSLKSIGYLYVQVENITSQTIVIGCMILSMCIPDLEFNYVNPSTQLSLFSLCLNNGSSIVNITWKIYQTLTNDIQWIPYQSQNHHTKNLTIPKELFNEHKQIIYWRFEVIYSFESTIMMSTFDIEINQKPSNGSCIIYPLNGTKDTLFTIHCSNWYDRDQIKDYLFYGWTKHPSRKMMLGFTNKSMYQLRLPASIDQSISLHIIVQIRDTFDAITEFYLPSVNVCTNSSEFSNLINDIPSILPVLNQINDENIKTLVENGIPPTDISITSLDNEKLNIITTNSSILIEFNQQVNQHAEIREQLMTDFDNLAIIPPNDLKFQSSILSQLTRATNQLTRKTLVKVSNKCLQFSEILKLISTKISYEDVELISTYLLECAANLITGANQPLQGRTNILNLDLIRITEEIIYDCHIYYDDHQINLCYQKQTADKILQQISEIKSLITSSLNIHLNLNQSIIINSSSIYFSLEKTRYLNSFVLIQSMMEVLSTYSISAFTNLSRSISLSILDENGENMKINTTKFVIPRDPNLLIPKMFLQNVTDKKLLFNFHLIYLKQNFSIHFELHSFNRNISYLLIYQFDSIPKLTSQDRDMNDWILFCSSNKDDEIFSFFIDNNQTFNHHSITFGIRELSEIEVKEFCFKEKLNPPTTDQLRYFTSNYEIRTYLSACYYLDSNNQWNSNGLIVGRSTNHYQTQCIQHIF